MMQRIKIPCLLGIAQASLTLLSLRCGIVNCQLLLLHLIKLCFKMACLLGIAQASLALLSLRCAIARPKIKLFFSVIGSRLHYSALVVAVAIEDYHPLSTSALATMRSKGVVSLMFSRLPSTSDTAEPRASTTEASSVKASQ